MVGILVHGDNHFIVRGPKPDVETARSMVRHWSVIQIGAVMPVELRAWRISTKEFREELEWAMVVGDDREMTDAVRQLLGEMSARGVEIEWV
jgi:hypothetical protein